jgi:prepilin-type N-terminal cleavage/methylation domain-containing protein
LLTASEPRRRPRTAPGFTIVELLVALALISLVAALAVPAFFERSEVTLDNACEILVKDLRLAQNRAAFRRTEVRVEFLPDGDGYRILDPGEEPIPHPYVFGEFGRRYSADAVFEGVRLIEVECGEDGAIVWTPEGTCDEAATIVIAFGNDSRVVALGPGRGEVHVLGR